MSVMDTVLKKWCAGELDAQDERIISFALACFLKENRENRSQYAFEVEKIRDIGLSSYDARFSPDIDLWEQIEGRPMSVKAYEVKSSPGNKSNQKSAIYSGIGQAISLLDQPYNHDPVFEQVYLAIPKQSVDSEWVKSILRGINETPIGCVTVGLEGYETVIEADRNPFYTDSPPQTPDIVTAKVDDKRSIHKPKSGIYERAKQISKKYDIQ